MPRSFSRGPRGLLRVAGAAALCAVCGAGSCRVDSRTDGGCDEERERPGAWQERARVLLLDEHGDRRVARVLVRAAPSARASEVQVLSHGEPTRFRPRPAGSASAPSPQGAR